MGIEKNGVNIECVQGDISRQDDVDVVVNAANSELAPGGGVAGVIHRAAGSELYEECKDLAPIDVGECVLTNAYNLPNTYVIHCLGPRYGIDKPEKELLSSCYANALELADGKGVESIAFPSISTGAFGYPFRDAAEVALGTVFKKVDNLKNLEKIRFVLYSQNDFLVFKDILGR